MSNTAQDAIAKLIAAVLDLRAGFPESELGEELSLTVSRGLTHLPEEQWKDFDGYEGLLGIKAEEVRALKASNPPTGDQTRPENIHGVLMTDLRAEFDPESENVRIFNSDHVIIAEVPQFGPDLDEAGQGEIQTAIANAIIKGLTP